MREMPVISVIVPVLHEAAGIDALLDHVRLTAAAIPIEIIVVDGDPAGSTVERIQGQGVVTLRCAPGRGAQMNRGAETSRAQVLLFLHADTRLPSGAFPSILKALCGNDHVGGAFNLGIDSSHPLLRLTARCASFKHRLTRVPYGDQAIFIRGDFFRETGGYREMPLFEDVELMRRIKKLKKTIVILEARTTTSPRKWEKEGILYTIVRNWTLQTLHLIGVSPEVLVRWYYPHAGRRG